MRIHVPNSAFIGNIESFTNHFDPTNPSELIVTSNQSWISIHPIIISMVIALAEEVRESGGSIQVQNFNAKSRPYLLRMGLISALDPNHGIVVDEHEASGRFIPARIIQTSEQLSEFITEVVPLLHTTPEQAYPIKYLLSELVRNALEHSLSPFGAIVSAQYFKKTNRIAIGVVDRGIGIKTAINTSYSTKSDKEAIGLALRPGITGVTKKIGGNEFNAGAGLFFSKSIAKVSKDFFIVYSGDSFFKLLKTTKKGQVKLYANPLDDNSNFKEGLPYWKGTAVGIDISMDINQAFDELLKLIRDAYHLDVKHANKSRYKKPKFQ